MGLFWGAPLPVVVADPELAPELPVGLALFITDLPGALAPTPDAPVWASANDELDAEADAKDTAISFMLCPSVDDRITATSL